MAYAVQENFKFHRGRTYSRDFTINDFPDVIDKILFTVCEDPSHKNYCIRKSLEDGITLVDEGTDETGANYKTYNLLIEATDTDHLKTNTEYGYDIVLFSGDTKYQLIEGSITLLDTYTKTCNEC